MFINYSKKVSFHYLTTNSASPHGMGFIYTREGKAEDPDYFNAGFRFLFWKLQNLFLPVCRDEVQLFVLCISSDAHEKVGCIVSWNIYSVSLCLKSILSYIPSFQMVYHPQYKIYFLVACIRPLVYLLRSLQMIYSEMVSGSDYMLLI